MRVFERHPSRLQLGAWFDLEADDSIGVHVARCARCRAWVSELARVRSVLNAVLPDPPRPAGRRARSA